MEKSRISGPFRFTSAPSSETCGATQAWKDRTAPSLPRVARMLRLPAPGLAPGVRCTHRPAASMRGDAAVPRGVAEVRDGARPARPGFAISRCRRPGDPSTRSARSCVRLDLARRRGRFRQGAARTRLPCNGGPDARAGRHRGGRGPSGTVTDDDARARILADMPARPAAMATVTPVGAIAAIRSRQAAATGKAKTGQGRNARRAERGTGGNCAYGPLSPGQPFAGAASERRRGVRDTSPRRLPRSGRAPCSRQARMRNERGRPGRAQGPANVFYLPSTV